MIKLKLNWFTNANVTSQVDLLDNKEDGLVSINVNGTTYVFKPETLNFGQGTNFLGIGAKDDAQANINFAKYYIETNGNVGTYTDFVTWLETQGITKVPGDVITPESWGTYTGTVAERITAALAAGQVNVVGADGVQTSINAFLPSSATQAGLDPVTGLSTEEGVPNTQASAFNAYYNDVYSLAPGTGGAGMLSRLEQSYMNQAQQQATMADVQFQQAAMQQAQTVKQITDQVRSERFARLRAGMSESQIANQDMQMLMTNVNTLNQNAGMLNDQRLQAQIGMNTAQDQAYADFLAQANQRGQVASAMAASDAGDPYQQTIRRMSTLYGNDPTKWLSRDFTREYNIAATGNPAGTTNR
jgi:uncharacterized protein YbcV (DUF1398 family)